MTTGRGATNESPGSAARGIAIDSGCYLLVLRLRAQRTIRVGRLGRLHFPRGFYVYVGSARRRLTARVARHRRARKPAMHWHIDYLRERTSLHAVYAIPTTDRIECEVAAAVRRAAEWDIRGFGCSDCRCGSHLFGFAGEPPGTVAFSALIRRYRAVLLPGRRATHPAR